MGLIEDAQGYLKREGLSAWLVYDSRRSNPVFFEISGGATGLTRPVFYFVPAAGEPTLLVHAVDAERLKEMPGSQAIYSRRDRLLQQLRDLTSGMRRIAMEYVPEGALPLSSRVDAGTLELIKSFGVEVVSSADLVQEATARWTDSQLATHRSAAAALTRIVHDGFLHVGERLRAGSEVTELGLQGFLSRRMEEEGLEAPDGPIVAVNEHSADPHYEPTVQTSSPIRSGDWLLVDIWARQRATGAVYADITWTAAVHQRPADDVRAVFDLVTRARDAAVDALTNVRREGRTLRGHEVDAVARAIIDDAGYGDAFTHRLGHSIGPEVHGNGANLDGFETYDTRRLIDGVGFSVEPGIYLEGRFGVRSEINVYLGDNSLEITTPPQTEIVVILP